jgi:AcrR family transcriptional regulator
MANRGRPRSFDRDAALRSAMELFWAQGYDGTSLADLTKTMGINAPSLYAAFGCKEALFREAATLYVNTIGGVTSRALDAGKTARESVDAMLRVSAELPRGALPTGCLVVHGAPNDTADAKGAHSHLAALRRRTQEQIKARLKRGASEGDLPGGADLDAIAGFYTTVLHGLAVQSRDGASRQAQGAIIDCAMAAWDALVTPKAKTRRRA